MNHFALKFQHAKIIIQTGEQVVGWVEPCLTPSFPTRYFGIGISQHPSTGSAGRVRWKHTKTLVGWVEPLLSPREGQGETRQIAFKNIYPPGKFTIYEYAILDPVASLRQSHLHSPFLSGQSPAEGFLKVLAFPREHVRTINGS